MQWPVAKTTVGWLVEAGVPGRSSLDRRQEKGDKYLNSSFPAGSYPLPLTNPSENLGTWETQIHTAATLLKSEVGKEWNADKNV